MCKSGQDLTREVYEDAVVVSAFNGQIRTTTEHLDAFIRSLRGKRIIDIGCGPGRDARYFARPGYRVTGVDYSNAMIREARSQSDEDGPQYFVLDMRAIGSAFPPNSFDGTWLSASLLHIPEADAPTVLSGVYTILAPGGQASISLKAGVQGPARVREHKHGREIEREFIFWEQDRFEALLHEAGFRGIACNSSVGGITGGAPTHWLRFSAEVDK